MKNIPMVTIRDFGIGEHKLKQVQALLLKKALSS
jgi:hypothetical protein